MVKISFQTIVFNTESTLPQGMLLKCIENVIPYAHEVILVEGATKATTHYFDGSTESFTTDGKSNDGTLSSLKYLESKYNNVKVIYGDGFWNGKTSMCNEAAKIATGDYIWQLDSDEFYHHSDIEKIIKILEEMDPHTVQFYANHFVFNFDNVIDETNGQRWGNDIPWIRIFKHIPGYSKWIRHEPPLYSTWSSDYTKNISRGQTLKMGIKMYHYSYVVKSQFEFKGKFYGNPEYMRAWNEYKRIGKMNIFDIEPKAFTGTHPQIISDFYTPERLDWMSKNQ